MTSPVDPSELDSNVLHLKAQIERSDSVGVACAVVITSVAAIPYLITKLWTLSSFDGGNGLACCCFDGYLKIRVAPEIEPDAHGLAVVTAIHAMTQPRDDFMHNDIDLLVGGIFGSTQRARKTKQLMQSLSDLEKWLTQFENRRDIPEHWRGRFSDKKRRLDAVIETLRSEHLSDIPVEYIAELRQAQEVQLQKEIMSQRKMRSQCIMCGKPLGFFRKLMGHERCTDSCDSFKKEGS